jgi:thiamine-phosphate pyrophosphorylase
LPAKRKPILCYVTDRRALLSAPPSGQSARGDSGSLPAQALRDCIRRAARCGISWIQIREKDLHARTLLELARFAVSETRGTSSRILINERLDVALAANAAGIHLGEKSLPLETVVEWRRSAGRLDFMIGMSCHSVDSARSAAKGGADYIFLKKKNPTKTKKK